MKKPFRLLVLCLTICMLLEGCFMFRSKEPMEMPYGVWYCQEVELTLYIDPIVENESNNYQFLGNYRINGVDTPVIVFVDTHQGGMTEILMMSAVDEDGYIHGDSKYSYFTGYSSIENGKLLLDLLPDWQEETGYKALTFILIQEYPMLSSSI